MISLLRGAVEHGVTVFTSAEISRPYASEELVGEVLAPLRGQVVISSKFGWEARQIWLGSPPLRVKPDGAFGIAGLHTSGNLSKARSNGSGSMPSRSTINTEWTPRRPSKIRQAR